MRAFGLRLPIVALAFLLTLGTALGAQRFVFERSVRSPLEAALLDIEGVEAVAIETGGGLRAAARDVRVRLSREADLPKVYPALEREVQAAAGSAGILHVEDRRTDRLEKALRDVRLAIEEGIATGAFRAMAEEVQRAAALHGIAEAAVSVDEGYVYLTLRDEEGYLHHVARRWDRVARGSGGNAGLANARSRSMP